jgi:anti-sigma-K factor RskA
VSDRPNGHPYANDRERFDDLKEAYALGALPEPDRRWFDAYLSDHPELASEVDELLAAANLLAFIPEDQEPPPSLRKNLMERIEADSPRHTGPMRERRRLLDGLSRWARPLAAAAAVLVVVGGLSAWNVSLQNENQALREDYESLQGQVEERQTYPLEGPAGEGEVVALEGDRGVLVARGLEPPPEGRVYEAWVLRDGVPEPAGLFEPEDGTTAAPIEGSLRGADAVAVTIEPEGGSPMPTGDVVLSAELT